MGRKTKQKTDEDVRKARRVISKFGTISPSSMNRSDQEDLISIYYSQIHGVALKDIPDNQLHRITERLYNSSFETANLQTSYEKGIIQKIIKLDDLKNKKISLERDIDELEERICIQTENLPESHPAVQLHSKLKY